MEVVLENFCRLYNRWKSGGVRKEDTITQETLERFCKRCNLNSDNCVINGDKVDVHCDLNVDNNDFLEFKLGKIYGDFSVAAHFDSMKSFPEEVEGDLYVPNYDGDSIEGCPERIGGNLLITGAKCVKSLEGLSKYIGGNFTFTRGYNSTQFTEDDIPDYTVIEGTKRFGFRSRR